MILSSGAQPEEIFIKIIMLYLLNKIKNYGSNKTNR